MFGPSIRTRGRKADVQVVEVVLVVTLNVPTKFINNVADTDIDFPVVSAKAP